MSRLLVSYVILTKDRRDEVLRCLDSVRRQEYPRKEIVVVDNGSSDGSAAAIRKHCPRARLIALETNHGVSGGRNRGAAAAQGDICVFIDDDAWFADKGATESIAGYFERDPGLACLALRVCDPATGEEDYRAIPRADKRTSQEDYPCANFCGAGFALRRRALIDAGMFWEPLVYGGEEVDLSYRLLDRGYRLHRTGRVVVWHRNAPGGRQPGQWSYFYARNRCWVALRNLPWIYVVTTTGLWWGYAIASAIGRGEAAFAARGIGDALRGIPLVLRQRRPIARSTVRAVKKLSGRLWC